MTDMHRQLEFSKLKSISRTQPCPQRLVLNPIMSQLTLSQRNLSYATAHETSGSSYQEFYKSLDGHWSKTARRIEFNELLTKKDASQGAAPLPDHLKGILKLKYDFGNGMPFFEFSIKDPEHVLCARASRTDDTSCWFYTFHHLNGTVETNSRLSPDVGQMKISCFPYPQIRDDGVVHKSTVTEFVLYDLEHARRDFAAKDASGNEISNSSVAHPWEHVDLHPHLETAAIVIQAPHEELKEKYGRNLGDQITDEVYTRPNLMNVIVLTASGDSCFTKY